MNSVGAIRVVYSQQYVCVKRGREGEGENSLESEQYYIYFPWLEVLLGIIFTLCHRISVIKLNQRFFERRTVWGINTLAQEFQKNYHKKKTPKVY